MSDMFPIRYILKIGDAPSPLFFNFAVEFVIRRAQLNTDSLKLNGTHQLLAYADDVNHLTPNGHYMGLTAQLTSRCCILYIYSTNICTEYFKYAA